MENQESLHQLLKQQTAELHEKAHSIPYIMNLLKNDIPIESYVGHLRSFAIIYGTLERQLSVSKYSGISRFLNDYSPKLPFILSDIEKFNAKTVKDIIPAVSKALHVADKILMYSEKSPIKLIGFLYTLDGSLNGGSVFKIHLSKVFGLEDHLGISYFASFNEQYKLFWENFTSTLNSGIADKQEKEDILSSAKEIFIDIMGIYESLFPFSEKDLQNHITALNPEAGNFPISTNPLEIEAAIIAGQRCWNEFPYYEQRYGERGKRFTVSDSVWLVNLCELSPDLAFRQVKWLSDYLAHRGMPTITMEFQMECLYQELSGLIPENEPKYNKLLRVSEKLKNNRDIHIDSTLFEKSNTLFAEICRSLKISGHNMRNTGKLIASSVADQKAGITAPESDFKSWISDPENFSPEWVQAIEKAYSEILKQLHRKNKDYE